MKQSAFVINGGMNGEFSQQTMDEVNVLRKLAKFKPKASTISLSDNGGIDARPKVYNIPPELFKSFDELDKAGKMKTIIEKDPTLYVVIYADKFGKWPKQYEKLADANLRILYEEALKKHKIAEYSKLDWPELVRSDKQDFLHKFANDVYRNKFYAQFGKYPTV